jgi:hypothetical protein
MRLTCGSKRVEKQIKDVEDKNDELRAQVSYPTHGEHFEQILISEQIMQAQAESQPQGQGPQPQAVA